MKKPTKKESFKLKPGEALVLRTCNSKLRSFGGFQWPKSGPVSAPDWEPTTECGNGLHGLLKGEGNSSMLLKTDPLTKWLAVLVKEKDCIDLGGIVKFPSGNVIKVGTRDTVIAFIKKHHPEALCVYDKVTVGDYGTAVTGDSGTSIAGFYATAKTGSDGTAKTGSYGKSIAGFNGIAITGDHGTAITDIGGTAMAGYGGIIMIKYYDNISNRCRYSIGYIGESGILPNIKYRCTGYRGLYKV